MLETRPNSPGVILPGLSGSAFRTHLPLGLVPRVGLELDRRCRADDAHPVPAHVAHNVLRYLLHRPRHSRPAPASQQDQTTTRHHRLTTLQLLIEPSTLGPLANMCTGSGVVRRTALGQGEGDRGCTWSNPRRKDGACHDSGGEAHARQEASCLQGDVAGAHAQRLAGCGREEMSSLHGAAGGSKQQGTSLEWQQRGDGKGLQLGGGKAAWLVAAPCTAQHRGLSPSHRSPLSLRTHW